MQEQVESLEQNESDEIGKLQDRVEELEDQLDDICNDGMRGALETVKYWLHDFFYGKCVTKTPRQILRIVEDAL